MSHSPMSQLKSAVAAAAHDIAATLVRLWLEPPESGQQVVGVAIVEDSHIKVVVTVVKHEKAKFWPSPEFDASGNRIPKNDMREVEQATLEAAPASGNPPVTLKRLAALAGYKHNSYFRDAVRRLIDAGMLARVTGGVIRAPETPVAQPPGKTL